MDEDSGNEALADDDAAVGTVVHAIANLDLRTVYRQSGIGVNELHLWTPVTLYDE